MAFNTNMNAKVVLVDADGVAVGTPAGGTASPINVSLRTPLGDSAMDDTNDAVKVVGVTSATRQDDTAFTVATHYVAVLGGFAGGASSDQVDLADAGALRMTLDRKLVTTTCDTPLAVRASNTDGASTAFSTFTATASIRNYITAISIKNAHATTDAFVDFEDGVSGTVLYTVAAPAAGGATLSNGGLPLFATTANTALAYNVSAAVTTIYISISGYRAA